MLFRSSSRPFLLAMSTTRRQLGRTRVCWNLQIATGLTVSGLPSTSVPSCVAVELLSVCSSSQGSSQCIRCSTPADHSDTLDISSSADRLQWHQEQKSEVCKVKIYIYQRKMVNWLPIVRPSFGCITLKRCALPMVACLIHPYLLECIREFS